VYYQICDVGFEWPSGDVITGLRLKLNKRKTGDCFVRVAYSKFHYQPNFRKRFRSPSLVVKHATLQSRGWSRWLCLGLSSYQVCRATLGAALVNKEPV
jgi:hypothetical protein